MTTPVKIKSRAELQGEAEKFCNGGYASGGRLRQEEDNDARKDARMIKKAVGQHEEHDHKGKPKTNLKLRSGGKVSGEKPAPRADKLARGHGPFKAPKPAAKGGGHGKVNVNIIEPAASEGEKKQAAMLGLQAGAKIGAAQVARSMAGGKAGMAPPPGAGNGAPGGPPPAPGAMPPPEEPPMRRGGRTRK